MEKKEPNIRYSLSSLDEKPYDNGMAYNEPQNDTEPKVAPPVTHQPKKDPKQEELNRLQRLYWERDEQFEKAKGKRMILTILGFSIFYYWVLYITVEPSGIGIFATILPAVMMAVLHVFVNATIFGNLAIKGREETEILERIEKRYNDLSK